MKNDIQKVSFSVEEIDQMVARLGAEITRDYEGKEPIFIGLLKGCNPFMMDLLKYVNLRCSLDYMDVSSYSGRHSSGNIKILYDATTDVEGKDIIIVDDILDTGRTLEKILQLFQHRKANSIKLCVLLDKPEGRIANIKADYVGGLVPNEFVVGYGLDYNEKYRNLPYIGVLKEEIYSK